MTKLRELLQRHLTLTGMSVRTLSDRLGMNYPTVIALINKGHVPRKPDHREAVRRELGLERERWADLLAEATGTAEAAGGAEAGSEGDASDASGPDGENDHEPAFIHADQTITSAASVAAQAASAPSSEPPPRRITERIVAAPANLVAAPVPKDAPVPDASASLAQFAANAVAHEGISLAAFARLHGIPYLSMTKLINTGVPPRKQAALEPLAKALALSPEEFARALDLSKRAPAPARASVDDAAQSPLQAALQALVDARDLTTKAFAELADLSVLTATRLLKRGDLPGRVTTHEKLRALLGLSQGDYDDVLERSRSFASQAAGHDDHDDALPLSPVLARGNTGAGGSGDELADLLERLTPRQREALRQFVLTLI